MLPIRSKNCIFQTTGGFWRRNAAKQNTDNQERPKIYKFGII